MCISTVGLVCLSSSKEAGPVGGPYTLAVVSNVRGWADELDALYQQNCSVV
jgi:hypothetical protein